MSESLNRVSLIGVIGHPPTLKANTGQTAVCRFRMGTTERWKGKEGVRMQTDWHVIVVLGKTAENVFPVLGSGKRIYVEGKLQNRTWESDGVTHHTSEIRADRVMILGHDRNVDAVIEEPEP